MNGLSSLLNHEEKPSSNDRTKIETIINPVLDANSGNSITASSSSSFLSQNLIHDQNEQIQIQHTQSNNSVPVVESPPYVSINNMNINATNFQNPISNQSKKPINKNLLKNKNLIKLAIRKKSSTRRSSKVSSESLQSGSSSTSPRNPKSHFKPLEAGSRIRLTLVPSLTVLYLALVPHTIRKEVKVMLDGPKGPQDSNSELFKNDVLRSFSSALVSKPVKLIDDNLMNLSSISSKVLQSLHQNEHIPTFNSMDAAVSSLFGLKEYTAVRVTRAASSEPEGSILLKLETATPGDDWLIDDEDYSDDMLGSLGVQGDRPNSAFIKKVIARPRYKSDMKIYILPRAAAASLYVEERMLERDLIKGIIDLENQNRVILCSFDYTKIVEDYKNLIHLNNNNEIKTDESQSENIQLMKHESDSESKKRKAKSKEKQPLKRKSRNLSTYEAKTGNDMITPPTSRSSMSNGSFDSISPKQFHQHVPLHQLSQQSNLHSPFQQHGQPVHGAGPSMMVPYMVQVQPVYYYPQGQCSSSYQQLPPPQQPMYATNYIQSHYNNPKAPHIPAIQNPTQPPKDFSFQHSNGSTLPPLNQHQQPPQRMNLQLPSANYNQHGQPQLPPVHQSFLLPPLAK